MPQRTIQVGILGGQESDLHVLGELHKQPGVAIRFVYDRDQRAVAMEIAEILGVNRLHDVSGLAAEESIDALVVGDPRERFSDEIAVAGQTGAEVLTPDEALQRYCGREAPAPEPPEADHAPYSIDDALSAFERLFDRDRLLESLLGVAVDATGATAGSIMMYSEEADELYIVYATGLSDRVKRNTRQRLGSGIAGSVARERSGRVIRGAAASGLYSEERDRPNVQSAISVPLVWDERLLGVLNVSSDHTDSELDDAGLQTLERLSGRIANVLNESLKLEETRVRHREMSLRLSVGELSERDITPNRKFQIISNFLGDLMSADTVEMFIGTNEGDWLVLGGSNRRLSSEPELVRCDRGAISRAYLERKTVILTEPDNPSDPDVLVSSFVFVPLHLGATLGVVMLEFGERHKLDEFLRIKDSVTLELSRFVASERRERMLKRELAALAKVSDAAPTLLTCRTLDDLCEFLGRIVADALECERVSIRVLPEDGGAGRVSRYEDAVTRDAAWPQEDEERFITLKTRKEPFSLAFLNYGADANDAARTYHSLMAVPFTIGDDFRGGIIAYDKRPATALEDATFTELDQSIVEHVVQIAAPMVRSLTGDSSGADHDGGEARSYETVLSGNMQRFKKVIDTEMARADRYHHSFSVLVVKLSVLEDAFDADRDRALSIAEEISRGIQTRTRKTDFGAWIRRDTFAMVSLEGSRRIRFLVARLILYLQKDLEALGEDGGDVDILVGHCVYPSSAKTPEAMLTEAESTLAPWGDS